MKKNSLLFLASVAVLLANVGAAQDSQVAETITLPTVTVTAPRLSAAEQKVNASLNQLRADASAEALLSSELPMLKAPAVSQRTLAKAARDAVKLRIAKN